MKLKDIPNIKYLLMYLKNTGKNLPNMEQNISWNCNEERNSIGNLFIWHSTKEGEIYWDRLYTELHHLVKSVMIKDQLLFLKNKYMLEFLNLIEEKI